MIVTCAADGPRGTSGGGGSPGFRRSFRTIAATRQSASVTIKAAVGNPAANPATGHRINIGNFLTRHLDVLPKEGSGSPGHEKNDSKWPIITQKWLKIGSKNGSKWLKSYPSLLYKHLRFEECKAVVFPQFSSFAIRPAVETTQSNSG